MAWPILPVLAVLAKPDRLYTLEFVTSCNVNDEPVKHVLSFYVSFVESVCNFIYNPLIILWPTTQHCMPGENEGNSLVSIINCKNPISN